MVQGFRGSTETMPLTIGDVLDLIAEPEGSVQFTNGRVWHLKEGVDLNAPVTIISKVTAQSDLAVMLSEDDGSLCIMEM